MTDSTNNDSKGPTHIAYQVRDREGKKGFWTRIGSAWPHADSKGFNIQLDGLVPLDGRITLRVAAEERVMQLIGRASVPAHQPERNLDMNSQLFKDVTDQALDAFWDVIVKRFPQATTGDLSPLTTIRLQMAAEDAVGEWITSNVPSKFRR